MILQIFNKSSEDMNEIQTSSIDLVLTSPPYWDLINYGEKNQVGIGLTYKHYLNKLENILLERMRVLKSDTFIVMIVADIRKQAHYLGGEERPQIYPLHADIIQYFLSMGFQFFQHFIWKKTAINKPKGKIIYGSVGRGSNKGIASPPFLYSDLLFEHVLVFRKPGKRRLMPSLEERFKDPYNAIDIVLAKEWVSPIWHIESPKHPYHPATFPTELAYRLIKMYSFRGEVVLDPFVGSGTTIDTALRLNRNAIGYEINEKYVTQIRTRYPSLISIEGSRGYTCEIDVC